MSSEVELKDGKTETGTYARGLTWRSAVLTAVLIIVTNIWVLRSELLTGSYATGGTPPAVAVGWLLVLLGLSAGLGRLWGRLRLSRAEMLVIYAGLVLGIPMASYGIMRAFLPHLTVLNYFASPATRFTEFWHMLPDWAVVRDSELIRQCFEGAPNERVPWGAWLPVLARWSVFFLAVFAVILGMLTLFRHKWVEEDRLTFPILYLPLQIVQTEGSRTGLFGGGYFWCGFAVAFLFNLTNVLHAFNPAFKALGTATDLSGLFTERPWDAARPVQWHHFPQVIGLGYLVSLEVSFSVWFFFLLNKVAAVAARGFGVESAGMPFMMEQASGGYVMMAAVLIWSARARLGAIFRHVFVGRAKLDDSNEPVPYRTALLVIGGGLVVIFTWCNWEGLSFVPALLFFGLIFAYALVYARIRAEAGVPYSQLYPIDYPRLTLFKLLGTRGLLALGPERNLVLLSNFGWLSYNYYAEFMGAYQADGLRLADEARVRRSHMAWALVLALLVGYGAAAWSHLTAYYQYGENVVDGGTGLGDYRARLAVRMYTGVETMLQNMTPRSLTTAGAASVGAAVTLGLVSIRFKFLRFPLHPLGYLIATTYWNISTLWASFLVIWVVKSLILRLGGVRTYRRLIPAFVGLALGQFFFGGIIWGNMQPFLPMEISKRYWLPRV